MRQPLPQNEGEKGKEIGLQIPNQIANAAAKAAEDAISSAIPLRKITSMRAKQEQHQMDLE